MKELLQNISTTLGISTILAGIGFALLKKWFLDLDTYNKNRESDKKELKLELENCRNEFIEHRHGEAELVQSFNDLIDQIRKEKADVEDLNKSEKKIEKMNDRISELTTSMEKQNYRLDILIESRNDLVQVLKETRIEMNEHLREVKEDLTEVKRANTNVQVDMQAVKSRLG